MVSKYKEIRYYNKVGRNHRTNSPAVIMANGSELWYKDGRLHREDGPAIISGDGNKRWYKDGRRHRIDGPAVMHSSGIKEWHLYHQYYGGGNNPPQGYLDKLKEMGINFVRGSDG